MLEFFDVARHARHIAYRIPHIVLHEFLYRSDKGFGDALWADAAERAQATKATRQSVGSPQCGWACSAYGKYMRSIFLLFGQSLRICTEIGAAPQGTQP